MIGILRSGMRELWKQVERTIPTYRDDREWLKVNGANLFV